MSVRRQKGYDMSRNTKRVDFHTLVTTNDCHIPQQYKVAVQSVIVVYRSGISFNKSVDQVAASYKSLNRNTLAKRTLKFIANDY